MPFCSKTCLKLTRPLLYSAKTVLQHHYAYEILSKISRSAKKKHWERLKGILLEQPKKQGVLDSLKKLIFKQFIFHKEWPLGPLDIGLCKVLADCRQSDQWEVGRLEKRWKNRAIKIFGAHSWTTPARPDVGSLPNGLQEFRLGDRVTFDGVPPTWFIWVNFVRLN